MDAEKHFGKHFSLVRVYIIDVRSKAFKKAETLHTGTQRKNGININVIMNISEAKKIRIVDYLRFLGHEPKKTQGWQYWYLSPFREEKTPSFKVNDRRNEWYDFALGEGGDIIDLGKQLFGTTSIEEILKKIEGRASDCRRIHPFTSFQERVKEEMRDVQVTALGHHALLSYLVSRRIDLSIGRQYCREIHYELRGKHYYAIAFANRSGGFEVRNPYFKGCLGCKDITLVRHGKPGMQDRCCVVEGFMDFLSYLTLQSKGDKDICREEPCDFIVLNSVHNLKKCLEWLDGYRHIHCYLDNDLAGRKTTETIAGLYGERVTDESDRYAGYKDLNDCLLGRSQ